MTTLKLTYFDFDGGRGEAARLALHFGGIAFEDQRLAGADWPSYRAKTPFLAIPTLEVDGKVMSQSNSINRYVGKLAGLYPEDAMQAFLCDEIMDAVEDISTRIGQTMELPEEAKKSAREKLVAGHIAHYLAQFQAKLTAAGGEHFADHRLTMADLKMFLWIRWLRSGMLDHIPKDLVDRHAPLLSKHFEHTADHPKIREYYESRKKS